MTARLRINLYGGPGSGKSTLASLVFGRLKMLGCNIELVNEYIKSWAYEKRALQSFDQVYIFAKQQRLEDRVLRNGVDMIVTDSPLHMQCVYSTRYKNLGAEELSSLAHKFDQIYPSLDILINRHDGPYKQDEGRYQSKEEAIKIDEEIAEHLTKNNIQFYRAANDPQEIVVLALHRWKEIQLHASNLSMPSV